MRILPPTLRPRYPGMKKLECAVWTKFLHTIAGRSKRVDYNVRVGSGIPSGCKPDDPYGRLWHQITQKRIDAIVHLDNELLLCEVKIRTDINSAGQAAAYEQLYRDTFHPTLPIRTCIVCESTNPDDAQLAAAAGIFIIEVGADATVTKPPTSAAP